MPPALVVCPSCACHAKSSETRCPNCDRRLRREDGGPSRATVAVLMGLTAASAIAVNACSSSSSSGPVAFYGVAQTGGSTTTSTSNSTSSTSTSTLTAINGAGGSDGG
jgi:hypothetical protein